MYVIDYIRLLLVKKDKPRLETLKNRRLMKLSYVYDGDTIIVHIIENGKIVRRRCRLYGFDAPELSNIATKERAIEAKEFLKTLLPRKIPFWADVLGFDKYGRLLINPTYRKVYISEIMIIKGYAKEYYGGKKI